MCRILTFLNHCSGLFYVLLLQRGNIWGKRKSNTCTSLVKYFWCEFWVRKNTSAVIFPFLTEKTLVFFISWYLEWESVCMHCVENQQLSLQKNQWKCDFSEQYFENLTAQLFCRHLSWCKVIQTSCLINMLRCLSYYWVLTINMSTVKWLLYSGGIMRT